jgi:hypothetical protein
VSRSATVRHCASADLGSNRRSPIPRLCGQIECFTSFGYCICPPSSYPTDPSVLYPPTSMRLTGSVSAARVPDGVTTERGTTLPVTESGCASDWARLVGRDFDAAVARAAPARPFPSLSLKAAVPPYPVSVTEVASHSEAGFRPPTRSQIRPSASP